ncbi:hypothetical protein RRF57_012520 [Xylaria bambusicola]|uniref:Uncharacterized protein n=1 Tax=Xylaria bambusicola TaxID=326684 RepID=A0AAN7UWL7_9PEZI
MSDRVPTGYVPFLREMYAVRQRRLVSAPSPPVSGTIAITFSDSVGSHNPPVNIEILRPGIPLHQLAGDIGRQAVCSLNAAIEWICEVKETVCQNRADFLDANFTLTYHVLVWGQPGSQEPTQDQILDSIKSHRMIVQG